jgi:hypothetical protein
MHSSIVQVRQFIQFLITSTHCSPLPLGIQSSYNCRQYRFGDLDNHEYVMLHEHRWLLISSRLLTTMLPVMLCRSRRRGLKQAGDLVQAPVCRAAGLCVVWCSTSGFESSSLYCYAMLRGQVLQQEPVSSFPDQVSVRNLHQSAGAQRLAAPE